MTNNDSNSILYGDYTHITTIIFDLDGTLIKHTWQLDQITKTLWARFAAELAPVTHDEFYKLFWAKNEDMWYMAVDGVLDGETANKYSYINTLRALRQDTTLAEPMARYWNELVLDKAVPFEDTFTVLDALRKNYTTGILTNGFTTLQRGKINRHNLAAHVDFTLIAEEVGHYKPDKEIFFKALQMAGNISPWQTLYVGDNLIADIQGAQEVGIKPIFINPSNDLDPPGGVVKIRQLSELPLLLKT